MGTGCECSGGGGLCERHQCFKTEHYMKLCATRQPYFDKWERGEGPCLPPETPTENLQSLPRAPLPPSERFGPGTELKAILQQLGIGEMGGCQCKQKALEMDRMRVEGCRQNMEQLVSWLQDSASRLNWWDKLKLAGSAMLNGTAFQINPTDPIRGLLELAIERAEKRPKPQRPIIFCKPVALGRENLFECTVCGRKIQTPGTADQIHVECPGEDYLQRPTLWQASDYQRPIAPILTRDLLYHVYPDPLGHYKWNIELLLKRWDLFNGKKAVGIVTGPGLDQPDDVQALFPSEVDFYIAPNENAMVNGQLQLGENMRQEGVTFIPCLEKLMTDDPTHVLFRAHTKGGRYPKDHPTRTWTEIMYAVCLDDWDAVEQQLLKYPCTGPFKKHNEAFDKSHIKRPPGVTRYWPWFWSGSFYWIHTASLGGFPNWRDLEPVWFAVEPYCAQFWSARQSGCLFHDGCGNLYSKDYHNQRVLPDFIKWKLEQHERTKA